MRKKNKKGITDDTIGEIQTVGILVQRINEEYEKRREEVVSQDRANAEQLTTTTKEEAMLIGEISQARKIANKMISDFGKIEADVERSEKEKAEKDVLREDDVKSGKVSLQEFNKKGKYDVAIAEESLRKSVNELEMSLNVIREKNLAILELEEKLGACRNTIRNLTLRPGITMLEMLKSLYEFTDSETATFMGELESLRTEWDQVKQNILLTQGKSMSGRHIWSQLTMEQARALQFNPILPLSCVEQLKRELAKHEGGDGISLTLYLNEKIVEITSISGRLIQTVNLKEDPRAEFTREKAGK